MFTFCPLQGALSESGTSQSLLELDGGVKVLISVGWDESLSVAKLRELEKQVPTLSLILLTHANISHLGAYAYLCKNLPLFTRIPAYATRPVIDLGRTLLQDLYASAPEAATTISPESLAEVSYAYSQNSSRDHTNFLLQPPTHEEIARYFSLIQPLKYSQPHQPLPSPFSPPLNGLTITAYNSGHTLGGTIWHIQHGLESIVYAVDWNLNRENVFSGAAWLSGGHGAGGTEVIEQLRKPTALICSSRMPEAPLTRSRRDEQLMESIKLCVGRGGTVLLPVDSSARVLELAYLLEHVWRTECAKAESVLKSTKLYLAARSVSSTMRNARSMLEWMEDKVVREFEAAPGANDTKRGRGGEAPKGKELGPFDFKHLRLLERKAQVDFVLRQGGDEPSGKVILASDTSMEWGFSKDIMQFIASDARNLVVLTERPHVNATKPSMARRLWDLWKERRDGVATEQTTSGDTFEQVYGGGRRLEMTMARRRALEGAELDMYQQWLATQRQLQATQNAGASTLGTAADAVDDASSDSSDSDEESDNERQGKALNVSTTMGQASRKKVVLKDEDLGVTILLKKKGVYDFDVRGKKGRERMFPVAIRKKRNDDFGEMIRPEDFLRAEEREDNDGQDGPPEGARQDEGLGKKRKWDHVGSAKTGSTPKRPQLHRNLTAEDLEVAAFADGPGGEELDHLEDKEEQVTGPSKLVTSVETVEVRLRIAFVDFSGRHDKRSLNMLIPLIQPRKLILVAGSEEETLALATDCRMLLAAQLGGSDKDKSAVDVFTPAVGTRVDASVDTNAWVVKLSEPLVQKLKWQTVRGLGIVTVTGVLLDPAREKAAGGADPVDVNDDGDGDGDGDDEDDGDGEDEDGPHKRQKTEAAETALLVAGGVGREDVSALPTLDLVPANLASSVAARSSVAAAQPLHVGDLRLADLRRAMLAAGHAAEFRGEGTLLVDGTVAVRKTAAGRVEVESVELPQPIFLGRAGGGGGGGSGGTFSAVRRKIYENLAIVAGA